MSRKAKMSSVVLPEPQVDEIEYEATVEDYLGDYDEQLQEPPGVRPYARQPRRHVRKQAPAPRIYAVGCVPAHARMGNAPPQGYWPRFQSLPFTWGTG